MPAVRKSRRIAELATGLKSRASERKSSTPKADSNIVQTTLISTEATEEEDTSSDESETLFGKGEACEIHTYQIRDDTRGEQICLRVGSKSELLWDTNPSYEAALVVRRWYDSFKRLQSTQLSIQSPYIKKALQSVINSYPGVDLMSGGSILVFGAPRCIFHYHNELQSYADASDDEKVQRHIRLCLRYMAKTLRQEISAYHNMMESDSMTPGLEFAHLWMAFKPGDLLYRVLDGQDFVGRMLNMKLIKAQNIAPDQRTPEQWVIEYEYLIDNGEMIGFVTSRALLDQYEGYRPLTELTAYPLKYHLMHEQIRQTLVQRGRSYISLSGVQHKSYQGRMLFSDDRQSNLFTSVARHRVILDSKQYYESSSRDSRPIRVPTFIPGRKTFGLDSPDLLDLSDQELLIFDYVRGGFSLTTKQWGGFGLSNIQDITFRTTAFDNLVLPQDKKDLISSLIKIQDNTDNSFDDMIDGKGRGLIILLHGPPGVGKTFTAEGISEYTKRPLYILERGDFSTALGVEKSLRTALFLATRWNAIALLDEADVFMEERSKSEPERNELISVLLRVLDYFGGILLLTTNRVGSIDPAFKSRVHLSITYPSFSMDSRLALWRTFILNDSSVTEIPWLDKKFLQRVAEANTNGRQIRNIVQVARTRAFNEEREMEPNDILVGLEALEDFENDFNRAVELAQEETRRKCMPRSKKRKRD